MDEVACWSSHVKSDFIINSWRSHMKAALCKSFDGPQAIVIEDVAVPQAVPGDLAIASIPGNYPRQAILAAMTGAARYGTE